MMVFGIGSMYPVHWVPWGNDRNDKEEAR